RTSPISEEHRLTASLFSLQPAQSLRSTPHPSQHPAPQAPETDHEVFHHHTAALCGAAFVSTIGAMNIIIGGKECKPKIPDDGVVAVITGSEPGSGDRAVCSYVDAAAQSQLINRDHQVHKIKLKPHLQVRRKSGNYRLHNPTKNDFPGEESPQKPTLSLTSTKTRQKKKK
ncbi:hypothetical protein PSHT_08692, partial [Puccinia striiformis]